MTVLKLRDTDLHWREIDGEIVALEGQRSQYVAANGSGTVLWRALVGGTTHEHLVDELVRTYGIDRARAAADVDRFLDALAEQHLLVADPAR
jgi:hypothetical protein